MRLLSAVFLAFVAVAAYGQEARCTELGSGCICSEPFQMTGFAQAGGGAFWNPNDTSTKQCDAEGGTGYAISRNTQDIVASTDATALAALPVGHSISRFMRAGSNHTGIFFGGNSQSISSSFVRISARWYVYYTPTYDFKNEGSCTNSKVTEHDHNSRIDYTGGFHTYNYISGDGWSPGADCCSSGPVGTGGSLLTTSSVLKGKWWRYEVVMTNRNGPDFRIQFFAKNVTDNGTEIPVIDLWNNGAVDNLTPPTLMSKIAFNHYRETSCQGWIGTSHYMVAGWTSDTGQRISAASEIEGGGGPAPGCGAGQTCLPFLLSDLDEAALDDFFAIAANQ